VRIALDASVLIAAHISRAGVCAALLEDVLLHHDLVSSEFILRELARKLRKKAGFATRDAGQIAAFLRRVSIDVVPLALPLQGCRDPRDMPVGAAIEGRVALLVSVDRDLLDLKFIQGIPIIRPGEFWQRAQPLQQLMNDV